jgi:transposase
MKRAKSDPEDAKMIAEYGFEKRKKLKLSKMPNDVILQLNDLYSRRTLLVKHRKALQVSCKEKSIAMKKVMISFYSDQNEEMLEVYNSQIAEIEALIEELLLVDKEIKENFELAKSVIGIGLITAGLMICQTNNFKDITDSRKYCSYIGIAPFPNSSGKRNGKNRVSMKGNKKLKGILSNCVQVAIMYDPYFKKYKIRLEGKNKKIGIIYNNMKNKLVHRVFSVVNRKIPYVKMEFQ